jgi:hypothetical protein
VTALLIDLSFTSGLWQWLANNQIQMGLVIGILGGLLTLGGLLFAGVQIKAGANALQASTLYQIQKDGRELRNEALRDEAYVSYVEDFDPARTYPPNIISQAERRVGIILQFYASIFNQRSFGTLNEVTWRVVHSDLCAFVRREPVRTMWFDRLAQHTFSPDFLQEVEDCMHD